MKLIYVVTEITIFTSFVFYIFFNLCKQNKNIITFTSFIYLIFGLLLFCYLLINELRSLNNESVISEVARPINYYEHHIDYIIIGMNVFSCVFRILGSIFLFLLAANLKNINSVLDSQIISKSNEVENSNDMNRFSVNNSYGANAKRDSAINISHSCESIKDEFTERDRISTKRSSVLNFDPRNNDIDFRIEEAKSASIGNKFNSSSYYKKILKEDSK